MKGAHTVLSLLILVSLGGNAIAEPLVLHTGERLSSAQPWMAPIYPSAVNAAYEGAGQGQIPADSPSLSSGHQAARTLPAGISVVRPVCILSKDNVSTSWVGRNKQALKDASCIATNLTESDFRRLKKRFPWLTMIRASAEVFAEIYSIEHYPVLITANGVGR